MRVIRYSGQFKKDYKRMQKRGGDIKKLRLVIEKLFNEEQLEAALQRPSPAGTVRRRPGLSSRTRLDIDLRHRRQRTPPHPHGLPLGFI